MELMTAKAELRHPPSVNLGWLLLEITLAVALGLAVAAYRLA